MKVNLNYMWIRKIAKYHSLISELHKTDAIFQNFPFFAIYDVLEDNVNISGRNFRHEMQYIMLSFYFRRRDGVRFYALSS